MKSSLEIDNNLRAYLANVDLSDNNISIKGLATDSPHFSFICTGTGIKLGIMSWSINEKVRLSFKITKWNFHEVKHFDRDEVLDDEINSFIDTINREWNRK